MPLIRCPAMGHLSRDICGVGGRHSYPSAIDFFTSSVLLGTQRQLFYVRILSALLCSQMKQKLPTMRKRSASSSESGATDSAAAAGGGPAGRADATTNGTGSSSTIADSNPKTLTVGVIPSAGAPRRASLARLNELAPLSPLSPLPALGTGRPPELLKEPGLMSTSRIDLKSAARWNAAPDGSGSHPSTIPDAEAQDPVARPTSADTSTGGRLRFSRFGSATERSTSPSQVSATVAVSAMHRSLSPELKMTALSCKPLMDAHQY